MKTKEQILKEKINEGGLSELTFYKAKLAMQEFSNQNNQKLVKACELALVELGSCYKTLGFVTSNVVTALNEAIESCAEPAQIAKK